MYRETLYHSLYSPEIFPFALAPIPLAVAISILLFATLAAYLGTHTLLPKTMVPVKSARLPAWCVAARCVGTIYTSVLIPRATCRIAR